MTMTMNFNINSIADKEFPNNSNIKKCRQSKNSYKKSYIYEILI